MVTSRPFRASDVPAISRIWEEHHSSSFSLPDRTNLIAEMVYEDENGVVVGYGHVKLFAEATIILDKSRSKRTLVTILKDAILEAFMGAERRKLSQVYVVIQDPTYAHLLQKQFGFEKVDAELLFRKVKD